MRRIAYPAGATGLCLVAAAALLTSACAGRLAQNRRLASSGEVGCPAEAIVVFDGTDTTWVASCMDNFYQCSVAGAVSCTPLESQFVTPELVARRDAARTP